MNNGAAAGWEPMAGGKRAGARTAPMRFFIIFPLSDAHFGSRLLYLFIVCVCALSAGVVGRKLALVAIDPKSPESLKQMEANCVSRSFPHR
jgi:hypothetical protein